MSSERFIRISNNLTRLAWRLPILAGIAVLVLIAWSLAVMNNNALALGAALAVGFWLWQLCTLMCQPDRAFPGRYDKILWLVVLIALNLLGSVIFYMWHSSQSKLDG